MTDASGPQPDASADPSGGPSHEGVSSAGQGVGPGGASVSREASAVGSQPREEGAEGAGRSGMGVEEALRLLARAWPQPPEGVGPSAVGDRIGRFTIDSLLGHGGFGIVYLAHDDQLRRWVALKIPRPHVLADPQVADRLRREARAAAGLDHPHIVPVLETGLSGPLWYLAMPYCDGPTLAEWLHNQKQPVESRLAARLLARLAGALDYSHAKGVIHGDLKPANVLLFPPSDADRAQGLPWTPRLTDFGLARIETEEPGRSSKRPRTGSLTMGTPGYMSPERIQGDGAGQEAAGDIYALGVILYELLIGRPPFQGTSFVDVADQVRFVDPAEPRQLRRDVPPDLQSICLKCLEKNPAARYATAFELQADLENFLDNRPTHAKPPSVWGRLARWIRRNPDRTALAAVAGFALLLGLGWGATHARLAVQKAQSDLQDEQIKQARNARLRAEIRQRREDREEGWQQKNHQALIVVGGNTKDPKIQRQLRNEGVAVLSTMELRNRALLRQNFDGYGVAYSPDGRWLVVGHNILFEEEGLALLFDAKTLDLRRELRFPRSPQIDALSGRRNRQDGVRSLLFSPAGDRLWLGTRGGCIHTWNLDDPADPGHSWQAHTTDVLSLVRADESNWLISLSNQPGATVCVWDADTAALRREFPLRDSGTELAVVDTDLLLKVEGHLERWRLDPATAERQVVWSQPDSSRLLSLHPDRQTLYGENDLHLISFDVATGQVIRRWTDPRTGRIQAGDFHELQVSPDGRWLLTSSTEGLRLWDLLSWRLAGVVNNPGNCRVSASFHPTRPEITITRDGRIEVWEVAPSLIMKVPMIHSAPVQTFDLDPSGKVLAEMVGERHEPPVVVIHSVRPEGTAPLRRTLVPHRDPVLAIDPSDGYVFCSLRAQEPSLGLIPYESWAESLPMVTGAMRARFDPDGRALWYSGSLGDHRDGRKRAARDDVGFLAAYDVKQRRETFRWLNEESQKKESVSGVLDFDVGRAVVVVSGVDRHLRRFDTSTGHLHWDVLVPEGIGDCVALLEERGLVLCGTRQGELLGFGLHDGRLQFRLSAHAQGVVALDAAGALAVTGDRHGQLVVWGLAFEPPQPLYSLGPFEAGVVRCQLTADANHLAVLIEREFGVRLYDLANLQLQFGQIQLNW